MNKKKILIAIGVIAAIVIIGLAFIAMQDNDAANNQVDTQTQQISNQSNTENDNSIAPSEGTSTDSSSNSGSSELTEENGSVSRKFTVDAFNFGYSLTNIEVNAGDTVTIELTNSGGSHDFVIDELGIATDVIGTGSTDSVTFTIPESASGQTYEFYCSVGSHREAGMVGSFIVN